MKNVKNQHGQNLTVIWDMKYKNKVCQNLLLWSFICMQNVKNHAKKTYDKASISRTKLGVSKFTSVFIYLHKKCQKSACTKSHCNLIPGISK